MVGTTVSAGIREARNAYRQEAAYDAALARAKEDKVRRDEELRGIRIRNRNAMTQEGRDAESHKQSMRSNELTIREQERDDEFGKMTQEQRIATQTLKSKAAAEKYEQDIRNAEVVGNANQLKAMAEIANSRFQIFQSDIATKNLSQEDTLRQRKYGSEALYLNFRLAQTDEQAALEGVNDDLPEGLPEIKAFGYAKNDDGETMWQFLDKDGNVVKEIGFDVMNERFTSENLPLTSDLIDLRNQMTRDNNTSQNSAKQATARSGGGNSASGGGVTPTDSGRIREMTMQSLGYVEEEFSTPETSSQLEEVNIVAGRAEQLHDVFGLNAQDAVNMAQILSDAEMREALGDLNVLIEEADANNMNVVDYATEILKSFK